MKRLLFELALLLTAVSVLSAFEWPLEQLVLTSTFAEHRGDHFHAGIDLGGGEQPVFPIASGEVVFTYREGQDYSSMPTGLGNFVVLQHQGAIRSLYAHLADGSMGVERDAYDRGEYLGLVGSSGYSSGKHLHLTIIDTEMGTIINPLLLLPPLDDRQAPEIKEVFLLSGQERVRLSDGMTMRATGAPVQLSATIYDLREDVTFLWKLAPYKVDLSQDGREISSLTFDSLHGPPDRQSGPQRLLLMNTELSFADIYESPWTLRLGEISLVPGETSLTVVVTDFSGNESSRQYTLTVLE